MSEDEIFYRRKLPHWHPQECVFFITFRLAHSLPQAILRELHQERERERRAARFLQNENQQHQAFYRLDKMYFGKYDAWLDQCMDDSPRWLAQESAARIVMEELHRLDGKRYRLVACCIMPNHVHLLLDTASFNQVSSTNRGGATRQYPLTDSLRLLKGSTARYCNQALSHTGAFWHHESYDHAVRDGRELQRIIRYILENPVKAGLVPTWQAWKFTYVSPEIDDKFRGN